MGNTANLCDLNITTFFKNLISQDNIELHKFNKLKLLVVKSRETYCRFRLLQ